MTVLAVAVQGRGRVAPGEPVFTATDDALQRGSAAFETVRVYGGRPFLLDRHVERLTHSAAVLGLPAPEGAFELVRLLAGVAPPDHVLRLLRADEAFVATAAALPGGLEEQRARGLALHAFHHEPVPLLDGVKSTSYAPALAARRAAEAAGADDALFVSDGRVLECATANVWWSAGGKLHTPASGPGVLAGVTRGLLLELEADVVESSGLEELLAADEAFTTSSIREVMPIRSVDGRAIGDGRPGPAAVRLQAALRLRSSL